MAEESSKKIVQLDLRYDVDRNTINTTLQATEQLERGVSKVSEAAEKLEPAASRGISSLRQRIEQSQGKVRAMIGSIEDLRQKLLDLDDVRVEPEIEPKVVPSQGGSPLPEVPDFDLPQRNRRPIRDTEAARQGVGDISTTFGAAASVLGGSSGLGAAAAGIGDLAGLVEYLPKVGPALTALGPAGVIAVGAGVAVTAALSELSEEFDRGAQSARYLINTQQEYYSLIIGGTRDSLEAAIESKRIEVQIARSSYEELNRVVEQGYEQTRQSFGALNQLAGGFLEITNAGGARELRLQRDEALKALRQEEFLLGRFEAALNDGATATADAEAAERALLEARAQAALQSAEDTRQRFLIEQRLRAGSLEEAEAYYKQLEQENNALIAAKTSLERSGVPSEELLDKIDEYNQQIEANADLMLTIAADIAPPLRQAEEDAKAAKGALDLLTGGFRSITDGIGAVVDLGQRFGAEYDKLASGLADNLQKLSANRDSRLLELADDLQRDLAELGQEFVEQQAEQQEEGQEQLTKFHKAEEQRAKEHHQRLLQISRDGSYAMEDAAADRNIRAALEAERSLNDRLKDEETAFDLESERRADELEALKDNLSDQERERLRDYQKRYNSLIDQNRREVAAVNSKYQQEVSLQHQAYNQQLSALQQSLTSETSLRVQGYNSLIQAASSFANGLISIGQGMVNSLTGLGSTAPTNDGRNIITPDYVVLASGGGGGGASRVAQIPTFATGGQAVGLASVNDDPRRRLESGLTRSGKLMFFTEPTTVLDGSRTRRLLEGDTTALPGGAAPRGGSNIINYQFGDIHVSVNGTNANPKQIAREVAVEIRNELQRRRA